MSSIHAFSMDAFSLEGKVAVVTGANQGLGMAYACAFAKAGADLLIPHLTDDTDSIRKIIEAEGRRVEFVQGDLTKSDYIDRIMSVAYERFESIDILVNNAGASYFEEFSQYPDNAWSKVIDINLNASYFLSHRISEDMIRQRSGKIIFIGSALSFSADKKCPPYTASKHGVLGLTRVFANELGKYNIQTNAICPGFYATEVNQAIRDDKAFVERITDRIPVGRWGDSSDLMGTAIFLASHASDYVNGVAISVDGGFFTTLI